MLMGSIIASAVLTIIVLVLSLITIQKGYGYKHTIDPPPVNQENNQLGDEKKQNDQG